MNIETLIMQAAAAKKEWAAVVTYSTGEKRIMETATKGQAETYAQPLKAKIGKNLTDRRTGEIVMIASVDIREIGE